EVQRAWLGEELHGAEQAGIAAIVVGSANLNAQIEAGEAWAREIAEVIIAEHASAYFYDAPEENVTAPLKRSQSENSAVPTFGSGTLGYDSVVKAEKLDFIGHSGFLLVEVGAYNQAEKRAPVKPRLIPNVGELAMEAKDGMLVRRSHVALFAALARRPRSRGAAARFSTLNESLVYIPVPANCVGSRCANGIFPEYTFSSSREDIGDFVEPNLATGDPRSVLPNTEGNPTHDPASGLFCAYNAGTTVVTISAGGLSASLTVTVQAGSVRRPCGTQPLKELPSQQAASVAPPPAPAPAPAGPAPASTPSQLALPPPAAPLARAPAPAHPAPAPHTPFFLAAPPPAPLLAIVPLPVPTPGRPTPPSGTSPVTSPVGAPEREEEEEEATESVGNNAVAYRAPEHEPTPVYILGIVALAAFAGASVRRRPGRGRGELRLG